MPENILPEKVQQSFFYEAPLRGFNEAVYTDEIIFRYALCLGDKVKVTQIKYKWAEQIRFFATKEVTVLCLL